MTSSAERSEVATLRHDLAQVSRDAAVLYCANMGWGTPFTCRHLDDNNVWCESPDVVGVSDDDGSPLCSTHIDHPEEVGHRLSPTTLAAIREHIAALLAKEAEENAKAQGASDGQQG